MSASLREQVRQRAMHRCEYCQMPEEFDTLVFHWDHIIAQKHRGTTELCNLAWSCFGCNNQKQSEIAGIDPQGKSNEIVRLFHPRNDEATRKRRLECRLDRAMGRRWGGAILRDPRARADSRFVGNLCD